MTGPEHYRIAQDLIAESGDEDLSVSTAQLYLAAAQVHATLALAAASFAGGTFADRSVTVPSGAQWAEVLS